MLNVLSKTIKTASLLSIAFGAAFSAANASADTVTVYPSDDTYVRGGTYANANYFYDAELAVKNANGGNAHREAMMRFSVSGFGVQFPVSSAKLRMRLKSGNTDVDNGLVTSSLHLMASDWDEQDVTYNNAPSFLQQVATFKAPTSNGKWFEIDVTDAFNSWGGEKIAFGMENITKGSATNWSVYSSDTAYSPELIVTYEETTVPCVTYTADRKLQELTLNSASCITVPSGLSIKEISIADSDANPSCNIRGTVSDTSGNSHVIDGNWEKFSGFTGTVLNFNVSNGCDYVKLRVRPL